MAKFIAKAQASKLSFVVEQTILKLPTSGKALA
jgi:hypothetical protein